MTEFSLTQKEEEQIQNLNQLSASKRIEFIHQIANKISDYISDNVLEILASAPEVNTTSTEEIQKAMEKMENEGTRASKRICG